MPTDIYLQIASLLKEGSKTLSEKWAKVLPDFHHSPSLTTDEIIQRTKAGIEILANILEGAEISSYDNFMRKLCIEWISEGGKASDIESLKTNFLSICGDYFTKKKSEKESENLIRELDDFLQNVLWRHAAVEYLSIYEENVTEKLADLPDLNESLKRLLNLTAKLGGITQTSDIWEELLFEIREIFPSVDAGSVFFICDDKLILKAVVGFEEFVVLKNSHEMDFGFYESLARRPGVTITSLASVDNPERIIFHRRRIKGKDVEKEYPRFMLSIQIVANDILKGLMVLYGFEKGIFFGDNELELFEILIVNLRNALSRSEMIDDLKNRRRDGEALIDIERRIAGQNDPKVVASNFLDGVDDYVGGIRSVVFLTGMTSDELIPVAWHDTLEKPGESKLSPLYTFALERKSPIFLASLKDNPVLSGINPPMEIVSPKEQGALGIIPLVVGGEIIGLWSFSIPGKPDIVEGKRFFLTLVGSSLAYNLKNALTYINMKEEHARRGREIHLAATLQQNLVPRYLRDLGYEIEVSLEAGGELAGDFAFLDNPKGKELFIAVGDVSGRGIAAGMSMMSAYGLMGELVKTSDSPASMLERLNNRLREQYDKTPPPFHDESFVTCFLISAKNDGSIKFSKAGHMPPILYRKKTDKGETIDARGMPLGIFSDSLFEEHKTKMESGDVLVLYTDGVTEARDEKGVEFGVDKLKEIVKRWHMYPPRIIRGMIGYNLSKFVAENAKSDDRTWIVISRESKGWQDFAIPSDDGKRKLLKEITDLIGKTPLGKRALNFSHAINEASNLSREGGQKELSLRLFANDERLHVIIKDPDPLIKGNDYPGFGGQQAVMPSSRKALALLASDVDFIWHNVNSGELNIFKSFREVGFE